MDWHEELKQSISTISQLKRRMPLSPSQEKRLRQVIERHPMRITPYYASLIDWNDPADPIMKMAVPSEAEMDIAGSYDTSGEAKSTKLPGLQHKYSETALILATSRCPMYCRHCFRKRLVGLPTEEVLRRFSDAAGYIESHREIRNVLISGGDPLILETSVIERFLKRLSRIPHLEFIRIGSRAPVTFPERILLDNELVKALGRYTSANRRLYLVTQFNHPAEISGVSTRAIAKVLAAGLRVINQTVLLRGVNDRPSTLSDLMAELTSIGVSPYYIFQCRPVKRVKRNFQLPLEEGYRVVEEAKSRLPGPAKSFRYVMSHHTGKVEILTVLSGEIYFRYHQARDRRNLGMSFKCKLKPDAGWLDDLERPLRSRNSKGAGASAARDSLKRESDG